MAGYRLLNLITLIFVTCLIFQACTIDPSPPYVRIRIKNSSGEKIDSIWVSEDTLFIDKNFKRSYADKEFNQSSTVEIEHNLYSFDSISDVKIRIYYANNRVINSQVIHIKSMYEEYKIIILKDKLIVERSYKYEITKYIKFLLRVIFIIFLFKVLPWYYLFKPNKIGLFVIKYTGINLGYFSFLFIKNQYFISTLIDNYKLVFLVLVLSIFILDIVLVQNDKNIVNRNNLILKTFVTDLLFCSLGLVFVIITMLLFL